MSLYNILLRNIEHNNKYSGLWYLQLLQNAGKLSTNKQKENRSAVPSLASQTLAQNYKFENTNDIAEAVKVGSPGRRKGRKKKSRSRKQRNDTEGSEVTETTDQSSPESSLGQHAQYYKVSVFSSPDPKALVSFSYIFWPSFCVHLFPITPWPISIKFAIKHPWVKGIFRFVQMKEHALLEWEKFKKMQKYRLGSLKNLLK